MNTTTIGDIWIEEFTQTAQARLIDTQPKASSFLYRRLRDHSTDAPFDIPESKHRPYLKSIGEANGVRRNSGLVF
jgi:hypothetical protein